VGGGSKQLLQGVNGYALPGRLLALMGPSGSGKTTLLDVLAGRKNSGAFSGAITLNGFPKEERTFNRITAYVEQNDIHAPLATVREAMAFAAALRLPASVSAAQRAAVIDETLALLELESLADRKIGVVGAPDGLAPGERKRLTIAVEMVSGAPILFLDEPTSGLDSRQALQVMRAVHNIAKQGRTVVCTVHQPSAEIFSLFSDLVLLARGGYTVYLGPLGHRGRDLVRHLQAIPDVPPYVPGSNASTWMLEVLQSFQDAHGAPPAGAGAGALPLEDGAAGKPAEAAPDAAAASAAPTTSSSSAAAASASVSGMMASGAALQAAFLASPRWKSAAALLAVYAKPAEGATPVTFSSALARSFPAQLATLLRRQAQHHSRNVPLNFGRFVALLGLMLIFGTAWCVHAVLAVARVLCARAV